MRLTEKSEGIEKYWQGKRKSFKVIISEFRKRGEQGIKYAVNVLHPTKDMRFHSHGIAGKADMLFSDVEAAGVFAESIVDAADIGDYSGWIGKDVPNRVEPPTINEDDSDYDHNANYEKGGGVDGEIQS